MRRIALALVVLVASVSVSACSGAGSALGFNDGTGSADHVIITVQGPTNIARVLPGAGLPMTATAVRGTQNGVTGTNTFRWSAALTTGLTYSSNTLGVQKPCANVNITSGGVTQPYLPDMSIYIAIDPTNESNIEFIPPTIIPVPATAPAGSTITTNYPYCVVVNAQPGTITGTGLGTTFTPNGPPGSIVVAVVNPANPLQ